MLPMEKLADQRCRQGMIRASSKIENCSFSRKKGLFHDSSVIVVDSTPGIAKSAYTIPMSWHSWARNDIGSSSAYDGARVYGAKMGTGVIN